MKYLFRAASVWWMCAQYFVIEFVSESVYVDLQYDEISLTFTAGFVWC